MLSRDSDDAHAVRALFKDENAVYDIRLIDILATAVAKGLRCSRVDEPVCMHAHGLNPATDIDRQIVHLADGGPSYEFKAIYDRELSESAPYYDAGVMITSPKLRVVRIYPHTVMFYVIVDGPMRGVRLCTL